MLDIWKPTFRLNDLTANEWNSSLCRLFLNVYLPDFSFNGVSKGTYSALLYLPVLLFVAWKVAANSCLLLLCSLRLLAHFSGAKIYTRLHDCNAIGRTDSNSHLGSANVKPSGGRLVWCGIVYIVNGGREVNFCTTISIKIKTIPSVKNLLIRKCGIKMQKSLKRL